MNIKKLFFPYSKNKKNIKIFLLLLIKITEKIPENKTDEIKVLVLKINKNIDSFNQNLSSQKNAAHYIQITKGIKDISSLLENISFEISFHKMAYNKLLKTLVIDLERILILLSKLIVSNKATVEKSGFNIEIKQFFAQALKETKLAKTYISNETDNFIENLKFSSIYDRMESCFIAADDINDGISSLSD
ncbi:MAG: hypothetical protein KKD35_03295 [Elusimicrobia bacterium]|nr:hypothetical protein [Elusimicrobiota bacterium]